MIEFNIPIKTVAGLNAREHHMKRARRVKGERTLARLMTQQHARSAVLPIVVTMTRQSAGQTDDDNLQGACKAVRDGIADVFGIGDNTPSIQWRYAQERVKRGTYGVRVRIDRQEGA